MNITLNCKISLSKKLRALLGKGGTLVLQTSELSDGKGVGRLSLVSDSGLEITELTDDLKTETSIMLTPVDVADNVPDAKSSIHASIFATASNPNEKVEPVVKKIAVVTPPERGQEGKAFKENIEVPAAFSELKNVECKKWISNMTELIEAINAAKSKKSTIDLSEAQSDRERAILMEMKEKEESIDSPAWVVNEVAGQMTINDLNISLPLNSPFDLSNLSAKRIAASRDLRGLLKEKLVKFISPTEASTYISSEEEDEASGLEVFDRHEEAEAAITSGGGGSSRHDDLVPVSETSEINADKLTEEEEMLINLTQNLPRTKIASVPEGTRHTVHGTASTPVTEREAPKNPAVKPIRKIER